MKTLERTPEETNSPPIRRWTSEECATLRNMGLLEGRYELIEGILYDKMGSGGAHSKLLCALCYVLAQLFGLERVRTQMPIRIPVELRRFNEPLPDVAVTKEGFDAYDENPLPEDLLLVGEVSDSSVKPDLTTKARLYAQAGVLEYWVVDVAGNRLVVHRQPTVAGYDEITEWVAGDALSPLALPDALFEVESLFPASKNRNA